MVSTDFLRSDLLDIFLEHKDYRWEMKKDYLYKRIREIIGEHFNSDLQQDLSRFVNEL